jgi:hypothetical protein
VAWSDQLKESFPDQYWRDLYTWYDTGGNGHVTAYLATLDITSFNPKAPPPKTNAFLAMVDANRAPENAQFADVLEKLGWPAAVTLISLRTRARDELLIYLNDPKNRRQIPHRMRDAGYEPVRNPTATDGLWKIADKRQVVYSRTKLTPRERIDAAAKLTT